MIRMNWALFLVLLATCVPAWPATYTSSQAGNLNQAATWGGAGVPGTGDRIVIGHAVTMTADATIGDQPVAGTAVITVNQGGSFTCNSGTTLTLRGDLGVQKGGTLNLYCNLNVNNPAATKYIIKTINAGSGTPYINVGQVSGSPILLQTLTTIGDATNFALDASAAGAAVNIQNSKWLNCGGTTQKCVNNLSWNPPLDFYLKTTLFQSSGLVYETMQNSATGNLVIDRVSFVNPKANPIQLVNSGAYTSGTRSISNVTCYSEAASGNSFNIGMVAGRVGNVSSDTTYMGIPPNTPGIISFNCPSAHSVTTELTAMIGTTQVGAGPQTNTGLVWDSILFYSHRDNPHYLTEGSGGAGSANTFKNFVCDGDSYYGTDTGDFDINCYGSTTLTNNLLVNSCGTLATACGSATAITAKNNTLAHSYALNLGESGGGTGQVPAFRNNLIYDGGDIAGVFHGKSGGLSFDTSYVRQGAGQYSWDYNAFYKMPGSGDVGAIARTTPPNVANAALGGIQGNLSFPTKDAVGLHNADNIGSTTTTTHLNCSTCTGTSDFITGTYPALAGDIVCIGGNSCQSQDTTYAYVQSVTSGTQLELATALAGLTSGVAFKIKMGYASDGGIYGTTPGFGTHDKHLDPQFRDGTRSMCSWYVSLVGSGSCPDATTATITAVARRMVTLNGWDYQGNPVTPDPNFTIQNALSYLRWGYTPQNPALQGAGAPADGSPDIGALPVASESPRRASVTWR